MLGRVCLVTGASSGIGKATAVGLARAGATVVPVCRDRARGVAVCEEIRARSGNQAVDLLVADLSSQRSVRQLAEVFASRYERLHVLINSAGVYCTTRQITRDGLEATFSVNYLAPFLLTNLLLDLQKRSAPSSIINVAGSSHRLGTIDFEDLQGAIQYSGGRANAQSKLGVVLFTYELARRLADTGVTANCVHPGAVATPLSDPDLDYPRLLRRLHVAARPFLKSPEQAAEALLHLAYSVDVEGVSGGYFVGRRRARSSRVSYDRSLAEELWNYSAELTGLSCRTGIGAVRRPTSAR